MHVMKGKDSVVVAPPRPNNNSRNTTRRYIWTVVACGFLLFIIGLQFIQNHHCLATSFNHNSLGTIPPVNASTSVPSDEKGKTGGIHVLLSLSGDDTGFFLELEILLKSLLLNAPVYSSLTIHMLCDGPAFQALGGFFRKLPLGVWKSPSPITIQTYNCTKYLPQWRDKIRSVFDIIKKGYLYDGAVEYHTIGTWFRLFAHDVLDVPNVIYFDTDIVVMANVQDLWNQIDDSSKNVSLYWGKPACAGMVILNIAHLPQMWTVVEEALAANKSLPLHESDQSFLIIFEQQQPDLVLTLPGSWNNHLGTLYKYRKTLLEKRPDGVGFLHFNGGGGSKRAWMFDDKGNETFWISQKAPSQVRDTFGLVDYYIRLPWDWARFVASSQIPKGRVGYKLRLEHHPDESSGISNRKAHEKHHRYFNKTTKIHNSSNRTIIKK